MSKTFWPATGMSDSRYKQWRTETIIKSYFNIMAEADEWGINEETVIEIVKDLEPVYTGEIVDRIIKDFKVWQNNTFEERYNNNKNDEVNQIVHHIISNPLRYFVSPSGRVTNTIGMDEKSITRVIENIISKSN